MTIKFKAKSWRSGNSIVLTVPRDEVKQYKIKEGRNYNVEIKEVDKNESSEVH